MSAEHFRPYVAAFVWLLNDDQALLLRRQNTGHMDGRYGLPAGHVEEGEGFDDAAIREALEEVGVEIDLNDLEFAYCCMRSSPDNVPPRTYVDVYFIARRWLGEVKNCEPNKCSELRWVSMDPPPEDLIPYHRDVWDAISRGEKYGTLIDL